MHEYYYVDANNKQAGPVRPADFAKHGIRQDTLIWRNGLQTWMKAGSLPELQPYFQPAAQPQQEQPRPAAAPSPAAQGAGTGNAAQAGKPPYSQKPDNNLVWALLTTFLCCWPCSIVAILKASQVDSLWLAGEYDKARKAADDAKKWSIISAAAVVVVWVVVGLLYLTATAAFLNAFH